MEQKKTAAEGRILSAEDYAYQLPDHWLIKEETPWAIMHHAYVDRVVEIVQEKGCKSVLEVGCGDGWNCGRLVEKGIKTVGTDWSKNGIEHAKRMVPGAEFYCGDLTDTEFSAVMEEPFDAAIFVEVIEHIPPEDCVDAMRKIRDAVKPGGYIVLTTPSANLENRNPQHYRHFTPELLEEIMTEAGGLTVDAVEGYGDMEAERKHFRVARWVNNRHYTIYALRDRLLDRFRAHCVGVPLDRCQGLIMTIKRD